MLNILNQIKKVGNSDPKMPDIFLSNYNNLQFKEAKELWNHLMKLRRRVIKELRKRFILQEIDYLCKKFIKHS